jgi:hypothetical protein
MPHTVNELKAFHGVPKNARVLEVLPAANIAPTMAQSSFFGWRPTSAADVGGGTSACVAIIPTRAVLGPQPAPDLTPETCTTPAVPVRLAKSRADDGKPTTGGQRRNAGLAKGRSLGALMCWMWPVPWLSFVFVLGLGLEGVEGEPIPDYSYVARGDGCNNEACYNDRTSGIRQAVDKYLNPTTNAATIAKYGLIQDWDVSLVTDMSSAFDFGYMTFNALNFTANISAWDVGAVETMRSSTYPPLSLSQIGVFLFGYCLFSLSFSGAH